MARTNKKFQFESELSESKADVVEQSLGPIVPFPDWMTKKISQHLGGTGVVGLCGGPGSGKKTILKQASSLPVQEYTIDRQLGINHPPELKKSLQPTLDGPCISMVNPAKLLTEGLVEAMPMLKYTGWRTKVVLVGKGRLHGSDKLICDGSQNCGRHGFQSWGADLSD